MHTPTVPVFLMMENFSSHDKPELLTLCMHYHIYVIWLHSDLQFLIHRLTAINPNRPPTIDDIPRDPLFAAPENCTEKLALREWRHKAEHRRIVRKRMGRWREEFCQ
jgi:shikimate kinase